MSGSGKTPGQAAPHAYDAAAPPSQQESTDALYRERAHLVAHLAAIYPSCIGPAHDVEEPGWAIVYVTTPEGQLTWHIAPRDLDLFGRLRVGSQEWDGHTTAQKYQRLDRLAEHWHGSETTWDEDLQRERDRLRELLNEAHIAEPVAVVAPRDSVAMAETRELREQLAGALAANQRWAETLGDVQQWQRERDEAREQLADLRDQLGQVADAANAVLDAFTRGSDGYRARLSGVTLMRAYKAIGRPVPDRLKHLEGQ